MFVEFAISVSKNRNKQNQRKSKSKNVVEIWRTRSKDFKSAFFSIILSASIGVNLKKDVNLPDGITNAVKFFPSVWQSDVLLWNKSWIFHFTLVEFYESIPEIQLQTFKHLWFVYVNCRSTPHSYHMNRLFFLKCPSIKFSWLQLMFLSTDATS